MDSDEMRSFIKDFSFDRCKKGNQGFSRILIQLFGLLGIGKSAFINTCIYVWKDCEFQNWAKASGADHAVTTKRIPYKLTENITLVDNRCFHLFSGTEPSELFAQLANLLPIGEEVERSTGIRLAERMMEAQDKVRSSDFIFPVFVHTLRNEILKKDKKELRSLFLTAEKLTGVVPIVVLTHKTAGSLTKTEGIFRDIGVDRIFSFENYTKKDHMKTRGKHEEVLKFLCEVIKDVQFRVEQPRDPSEEMKMRRKFVLSYIHESDLKEQQKKVEKKALEQALLEKRHQQQEEEMKRRREEEQRQQDEEFMREQQELQWERERQQARHEEEARESQEQKKKKKKKKNKFLGLF